MKKEIQTLDEILPEEHNLAALDKVAIKGKNAIAARIALGMELFFTPREQRELYPIFNQLAEDYYQRFKPYLNAYGLTGSSRVLLLRKNFLDKLRNKLTNINYQGCYEAQLFYDDTGQGVIFNANPWQALFFANPKESGRLSNIEMRIPVCDDEGEPHFDLLAEMVVSWCNQSKPSFGTAGFCFAYAPGGSSNSQYTYPLMQRHPGIEHMDELGFMVETRFVDDNGEHFINNRIKGVNWITILCNELIEELGGVAHCKATLEPDCYVKEYDGGVIIFAGPVPQLGDTYQGIIPERYRKVARFTQPIRFENYEMGYFKVAEPLDRYEETMKWIKRFD